MSQVAQLIKLKDKAMYATYSALVRQGCASVYGSDVSVFVELEFACNADSIDVFWLHTKSCNFTLKGKF